MRLLRCLWFFVAHFDIDLHAVHISGVANTTADQLSRNYMQYFFSSHPQVSLLPTPSLQHYFKLCPSQSWNGYHPTSPRYSEILSLGFSRVRLEIILCRSPTLSTILYSSKKERATSHRIHQIHPPPLCHILCLFKLIPFNNIGLSLRG